MSDRPDLIYRYDGSFDGLLCCVFESYLKKEIPAGILSARAEQTCLFPAREIETDPQRAARVARSIAPAMGAEAADFVRRAFLTCLPERERFILLFLRLGYRRGPAVMRMLTDDTVHALAKAVQSLEHEAHLLDGFLRFSERGGVLAAQIRPKNIVLPLMAPHFCGRYPGERFVIHDRAHDMALLHEPGRPPVIRPAEELTLPAVDANERAFRSLWRLYYDTVEVEGRHNPRCRMTHMPKRYWEYLTEMGHGEGGPWHLPG